MRRLLILLLLLNLPGLAQLKERDQKSEPAAPLVEEDEDIAELRELIEHHREYTDSPVAESILDAWPEILGEFVKVMPVDYKRVLRERRQHDEEMESTVHEDGTVTLRALER